MEKVIPSWAFNASLVKEEDSYVYYTQLDNEYYMFVFKDIVLCPCGKFTPLHYALHVLGMPACE